MSKGKIVVVAVGGVAACIAIWLYRDLTARGFSAREPPSPIEAFLARNARKLATPRGARQLHSPMPSTPLNIAEARDHYADHCAICHANNGSGKTQINAGLYPPAPDMRGPGTQQLSDGELFYIIKNGIRFTGMPGWGGEDEENWKLVAFIRHLPNLTAKELELMNEVNRMEGESDSHPAESK